MNGTKGCGTIELHRSSGSREDEAPGKVVDMLSGWRHFIQDGWCPGTVYLLGIGLMDARGSSACV